MSVTGEPDGPPTKSGLSLVDFGGGQAAAGSIMAGLWAAKRDGRGMDIDMSLFENAISMITYQAPWHLNGGFVPARRAQSAHPSVVPFQNFETADGWIVVSCPKEKFWQRLTSAIDMPQLADDPRYATVDDRRANEEDLLELLSRTFRLRLSEEWVEELTAAGVPCSPVNDIPAALRDPQTRARGIVLGVAHPDWETGVGGRYAHEGRRNEDGASSCSDEKRTRRLRTRRFARIRRHHASRPGAAERVRRSRGARGGASPRGRLTWTARRTLSLWVVG